MLKEKDLPSAEGVHKMSKESDGAYASAVNNIIIGIKETTETGCYEYTYWNKLPKSFSTRLTEWLSGLGYKVEFRSYGKSGDKNSLGRDIELMEVSMNWHQST